MNYTLHRNLVVTSTSGHSIEFKKGVPTHVPHEATADVLAVGAIPESELDAPAYVSKEPANPAVRKAMLLAAIDQVVATNGRNDFSGTGAPHVRAIAAIAGFEISDRERNDLWDEYMQGKAAAEAARMEAGADAAAVKVKADEEAKMKADEEAKAKVKADEETAAKEIAAKEEAERDAADAAAAAELAKAEEAKATAATKPAKPATKPATARAKAK